MPQKSGFITHNGKQNLLVCRILLNLLMFLHVEEIFSFLATFVNFVLDGFEVAKNKRFGSAHSWIKTRSPENLFVWKAHFYIHTQNGNENFSRTRMYSSGIRTARLWTVSQHALRRGVVYPSMHWAWGMCIPACTGQGVSVQGGVCSGCVYPSMQLGKHPRPSGQTDPCEIITFANFVCGR